MITGDFLQAIKMQPFSDCLFSAFLYHPKARKLTVFESNIDPTHSTKYHSWLKSFMLPSVTVARQSPFWLRLSFCVWNRTGTEQSFSHLSFSHLWWVLDSFSRGFCSDLPLALIWSNILGYWVTHLFSSSILTRTICLICLLVMPSLDWNGPFFSLGLFCGTQRLDRYWRRMDREATSAHAPKMSSFLHICRSGSGCSTMPLIAIHRIEEGIFWVLCSRC